MGKRLLSLLAALALAVSAFAGLTVAPAGAVVEDINNRVFLPFVPNGDEYGDMGPWYGAVTVQNPNAVTVTIRLLKADGSVAQVAELQPFASKTWGSSAIFGDGAGGGVIVEGPTVESVAGAGGTRFTIFRGTTENGVDKIPNPCGSFAAVAAVTVRAGDTVFVEFDGTNQNSADYTLRDDPVLTGQVIWIEWWVDLNNNGQRENNEPTGTAEPEEGAQYQVTVQCVGPAFPVVGLPIAAVSKIVAPVRSDNARTSAQHETVTGYTALPNVDVVPGGHVLPIAQTNNGWNSVLHVTNFDARGNCGVTVTLYETPTGYSDPSFGQFTKLLRRGETWHIDLAAQGVPAGWIGQVWIDSDCRIAATVDRVKPAQPWGDPVNMALTNQALPQERGNTIQALPLIFQAYNGWNTGISIANLSDQGPATVTITYYNNAGVAVGTENRVIQPRAMEFVYRPRTADIGIGGFGQALVTSTRPVLVAVDSVKYTGEDQDVGQALGYVAQTGTIIPGGQLYMPLFQKQGRLTGGNDNSGVALFNAGDLPMRVAYAFYSQTGSLTAPTIGGPIVASIPAHGGFILYAPSYAEMPGGFQGSVVVTQLDGVGPLVGVSNNVNYDVTFDGSAAFNMGTDTAWTLECTTGNQVAAGDQTADCTVSGVIGPAFLAGVPILLEIDDAGGSFDNLSFAAQADQNVLSLTSGALGAFAAPVYWRTDANADTEFTVFVNLYYDANNNGLLDPSDIFVTRARCEGQGQRVNPG
ncbi:MAG: hypothetical protein NZ761_04040 [Dehalococcoidia bacterium]|nr:hypothetical protein [Dehalococcoidia bacterium]